MANANDSTKDATMLTKTGRAREEWYALLDAFGSHEKGHKATAKFLETEHGVSAWWAQSITVDYERERGIREVGQQSNKFFAISVTRTIDAPVGRVWEAWAKTEELSTWFTTKAEQDFREGGSYRNGDGDHGIFKRIVPQERIRFTWENEKHAPNSVVNVQLTPKGESKTTLVISHEKLADKASGDDMKKGWTWALTSLKSYLESGKPITYEEWEANG